MSKIFTENFFDPCQKYLQVPMDLENFFDTCQKYLLKTFSTHVKNIYRKLFQPMSKIFTRKLFRPISKYLQVHVDLENFFDPCQKYLQVPMDLGKLFSSHFQSRRKPNSTVPPLYRESWIVPYYLCTEESWIVLYYLCRYRRKLDSSVEVL